MELVSFRVTNFRSINDSGDINVSRITSLLGRNESGKSNLLLALRSLNPAEGFKELKPIKDFPRHRRLEECTSETSVVSTTWKLSASDQVILMKLLPRAKGITHVNIGRYYEAKRWVEFNNLGALDYDSDSINAKLRKVAPAVKAAAAKLEDAAKTVLEAAVDKFEEDCEAGTDAKVWAPHAHTACQALRTALATADAELSEKQEAVLNEIEVQAKAIAGDDSAHAAAREWVVTKLPIFMYLDDYPSLSGHQDIAQYLQRKNDGTLTDADTHFEKLCKVAGLDAAKLQQLIGQQDSETRNQLANRASAVVTTEIRRLWKDRALKVRFNLDASHLDTFISDPNATYEVEVNLDERSRGFQWFFSFYITFAADTDGGKAANAILLLDEPGLYLHARSQTDLLRHFDKDFYNTILYTTHSPFMVPTENLDRVRTVNIHETEGTTVSNDPSGDARTLFPLQAALGYDLAQSLFVGPHNLVVEGVTDFWMLSSIGAYLRDSGKKALPADVAITPAGGAQKVSYMVALLSSEDLNVLLLLDDEKASRATKDDLVRSKLIREQNVIFVSEALGSAQEADIEDLLEPDTYEALVREAYAKELKGKKLTINTSIPRMAKRLEAALADVGIEFHKTRPMRLLLTKMASEPEKIVTAAVAKRFETLFKLVGERLEKHVRRAAAPFQ
ncbi:AAA family ATPase [Aminobacter sp. UC22_36]|uniref:AAA family ATPase n=1 Tax=Aminobacter sp. UC22_36 TaxID=3374549 RepID=UPI0037569028